MFIYYVYAYINKKTGLPYYIGKGKNRRIFKYHGRVTIPKDKKYIVFLEKNLSEIGALALERRYIEWYGRKNIETGILLNETAGGDGGDTSQSLGYKKAKKLGKFNGHKYKSPEKIISANKKRSISLKGHDVSAETRKKISEKLKGKPSHNKGKKLSEYQKTLLKQPKEKFECPHCNKTIGGASNFKRWHNDNCNERIM